MALSNASGNLDLETSTFSCVNRIVVTYRFLARKYVYYNIIVGLNWEYLIKHDGKIIALL